MKLRQIFFSLITLSSAAGNCQTQAQSDLKTRSEIVATSDIVAQSGGSFGGRSNGSSSRGGRSGSSSSFGSRNSGSSDGFGNFFFFLPFLGGGGGTLFAFVFIILFVGWMFYRVNSDRIRKFFGEKGVTTLKSDYSPECIAIKVQVMMLDGEEIKTEMRRIAENGQPNARGGLANMFKEACLVVLRRQDRWSFGTAALARGGENACAQQVSSWASEARAAFVVETTTNRGEVEHREYQAKKGGSYVVVTLAVAARGLKLPKIQGAIDAIEVTEGLVIASGVSAYDLIAAEAVWAPDVPGELLTADEALSFYPSLYKL